MSRRAGRIAQTFLKTRVGCIVNSFEIFTNEASGSSPVDVVGLAECNNVTVRQLRRDGYEHNVLGAFVEAVRRDDERRTFLGRTQV